jgi:GntR family transcriptional regulator
MLKFANYLKPLEEKLAFVLDKSLSITANTPSEEVGKMLGLSDCEPVFEIAELIRDEAADKIIQYAWFYVSTRYLTLKAETPKDSEDKRIF